MKTTRPNQVWAVDITYIPMAWGFLYLVAIIDWYSRYVLSGRLSNTMGGRESYNDNLVVERLWRTVKYEEVYLKAYQDIREAKISLGNYFHFYNTERPHQTLGYKTPAEASISTPPGVPNENAVESLVRNKLGMAGSNLNIAPILSKQSGPLLEKPQLS